MRCAQDIFGVGSETSSTTLEWAMAELIRNPKAMTRATTEVRRAFEANGTVREHALGELRYLHLVIRETFRLHAPVPLLLPRVSQQPCRVPRPVQGPRRVPAGGQDMKITCEDA
jgi:cytochrome P450